MKRMVLSFIAVLICLSFTPTPLATSVSATRDDWATDWGPWNASAGDNLITYHQRRVSHNPYSGACDWGFEIKNGHNYTADVKYGVSGVANDNSPYDHTALYQPAGSTFGVVLTVSNCSTVYFGAMGVRSK
jgi:hypothetical protein